MLDAGTSTHLMWRQWQPISVATSSAFAIRGSSLLHMHACRLGGTGMTAMQATCAGTTWQAAGMCFRCIRAGR